MDGDEIKNGTDPHNPDTDGDSILDGDEIENGTDPNLDDSNNEILVGIGDFGQWAYKKEDDFRNNKFRNITTQLGKLEPFI